MLKIALIDDKNYGLDQIKELHAGEDFSLEYFSSYAEFLRNNDSFDVIYLDYYLEKDRITADLILQVVKKRAGKVIAFSSVARRNTELFGLGADAMVQKK